MSSYEITVVMPALNEEANVERAITDTLRAFSDLGIHGEIILVNDGSRDKTGEIGERLRAQNDCIHVIHHKTPQGIGGSFWEGALIARGDVVTLMPGDGECYPYEILRYLPLMKEVDIIVPFVYNIEVRDKSRRRISRTYKAIINLSFGLLLNYMNGTVVYRKSVLQSLDLRSRGFFYQTELLIKAIRRGYLYAEVPYALGTRSTGKSTALTLKSFYKLSRDYLNTVYSVYISNRRQTLAYLEQSATGKRRSELSKLPRL